MKNDWEIKKLGEVCEINIGRTPERGNSKMWDKEKKTDTIIQTTLPLNFDEKKSEVEEEVKNIDILNITPIEAINILSKLKEKVK